MCRKFAISYLLAIMSVAPFLTAQQPVSPTDPPGTAEALAGLTAQPATHTSFSLDRDALTGMLGGQSFGLNTVAVTNYRFHGSAFYVPEAMVALEQAYTAAGWKHLVEANVTPREQASPDKPITDIWMHFRGTEIDELALLIRGPQQMNVLKLSGTLRPLDLLHLAGHFGIPRIDPNAVMVPAPAPVPPPANP